MSVEAKLLVSTHGKGSNSMGEGDDVEENGDGEGNKDKENTYKYLIFKT